MSNTTDTIVDVNNRDRFTNEDLKKYNTLISKEAYPELYGEEIPESLKYVGDKLIDMSDIERYPYGTTQPYRTSGINDQYDEIWQSIRENGFKLRYPAAAAYLSGSNIHLLTGYTRSNILDTKFGFTNIITSIYIGKDGYTNDQIESDITDCGQIFNTIHDPASSQKKAEIINSVKKSIEEGWCKKEWYAIEAKVKKLCGRGIFSKIVRSAITQEILNGTGAIGKIINHNNVSARNALMYKMGLLDEHGESATEGVKYLVRSTSTLAKTYMDHLAMAEKYPDHEIRLILNVGQLEGFGSTDIEQCFKDRISKFIYDYKGIDKQLSTVKFGGVEPDKSRTPIYGTLASVASLHDVNKFVYLDEDGKMSQK